MFNNIFNKTLYTKRWMTIGWCVILVGFVLLTMSIYPTFKQVGQSFNDVPDSLKSLLGDADAYATAAGFADVQIVTQYIFMTLILGIFLFSGLLAGEEGNGTLQSLLVQPVGRSRVYLEKLLAGSVMVAIVCAAVMGSVVVGATFVHESVPLGRAAEATLAMWVVTMVFSAWTYSLGAVFGRRGLIGSLVGVVAFAAFIITSLAESVKWLRWPDKLSPIHYYNHPGILGHGVNWAHLGVLAAMTVVPLVIAYVLFVKRDIYQQ